MSSKPVKSKRTTSKPSKPIPSRPHGMHLASPAMKWTDALPTGNGRLGAMAYGHVRNERILLNHEALWLYSPKPVMADVSGQLPELRKLLLAGDWGPAQDFLHKRLVEAGAVPGAIDPYQPACALDVFTETRGAFADYRAEVDFETGLVTVAWTDESVAFARQLFVSRPDNVIVLRFIADEPRHFTGRVMAVPHGAQSWGTVSWGQGFHSQNIPAELTASSEGEYFQIVGRHKNGNEFGGIGRAVVAGGSASAGNGGIDFTGADEAIVLVKLFACEPAGPALARLRDELEALDADFDALLERHAAVHRELFGRTTVDLDSGTEAEKSNDQLLLGAYGGDVPTALVERMFDYGRYLLICSSAPGGWPANLQGVWNGDYQPAWSADYHNDENIQMNYWQALPGALPEVTLPFFDYYERFLDDYRRNARDIFGCRGIFVPIAQSTHGLYHPGIWLNWTAGAGWLAQLFYDYFLFTGDRTFLADRAVPFLREVALFYEDFLFQGPDGRLVFAPSLSPENAPAGLGVLGTVNATMDVAIAREVLSNLCAACETLGLDAAGVTRWKALLQKLPAYEVNADGAIREWLWPGLTDNYHHRHQSHIYPLFPGFEVDQESAPDLFAACRTAVEKRLIIGLTSQTGWSLAHMANIYARLGEGSRALDCLHLIARATTGRNLFTYHNDWRAQGLTLGGGPDVQGTFQIDANFGLTAAVLEMLVYSRPGLVKLLPALPADWTSGSARGLRCRGGITVDISWRRGKLKATLTSATDQEITLKLPGKARNLTCDAKAAKSPLGSAYRRVKLPAGKPVRLSCETR